MTKRLVIIESPFSKDPEFYRVFLAYCLRDCIDRGEAPFASHGLYTLPFVLDDSKPAERKLGIETGFAWRHVADVTVVYTDYDITDGMRAGIQHSEGIGVPVEYRTLQKK